MSGDTPVPNDVLDSLAVLTWEHAPGCEICEERPATRGVARVRTEEWWEMCDDCADELMFECPACGCLDHAAPGGKCPLCSSTEPTVAAQVTITDLPHAAALRWARDRKVTT